MKNEATTETAKGKCECGHGPKWHGPYADGYCRGTVRASRSEGTPAYACRCEEYAPKSYDKALVASLLSGYVR